METVFRLLFFEVLGLGVIATVVNSFGWRDRLMRTRRPIEDKLLRSPGETLQRECQNLNDYVMGLLAGIAATPAILIGQMPRTISGGHIVLMALAVLAWAGPLIYLLGRRRNLSLALRGERAVAEELSRLMLEGCHVFHDYPAGPKWNIDHIIIAPSGVYAVETKTRRKTAFEDKNDYEVVFDGNKLIFPRGLDTESIEQVRRNAAELSQELAKGTAEPVQVKGIVTLPGWFIEREGKGDVSVLNPREIRQVVLSNEKPLLSAQQIQRIAFQVEQKCRDVEL